MKALIPVAHGTEEMEAVIVIDMLRRAEIEVTVAGLTPEIECSRGVKLIPDCLLDDIADIGSYDALILPGGGPGTENFKQSQKLGDLVRTHSESGKLTAAICAAPAALDSFQILKPGDKITSHPGVKSSLENKYDYSEEKTVVSGNIITSRGAGTAFDFAIEIISILKSPAEAQKIAESIVYRGAN
jgi:DJ-1 family protein